MAGAKYRGEYEERVKSVLNGNFDHPVFNTCHIDSIIIEVEKSADEGVGIILFVDELHLIMAGKGGEGGGMDAGTCLSHFTITRIPTFARSQPFQTCPCSWQAALHWCHHTGRVPPIYRN